MDKDHARLPERRVAPGTLEGYTAMHLERLLHNFSRWLETSMLAGLNFVRAPAAALGGGYRRAVALEHLLRDGVRRTAGRRA